ncbi:DUF1471 family protein YdgH [Proteus mirabilis]|uniref:DUF1471 family protein YdgH n=1 Tax=Proteus mirabilis TaxID=584 RepID=UPI00257578E3|nr:DUF1471 family protein YdgH [Proteus mirabilis]MDM3595188.1 DUF1471 family protein YdgH [Proteus mirabilis]
MKLKTSVIAAAVLSLTNITVAQAAQELSPEQAAELKPFERITVIGRFNAIYEAADAVSRRADKIGADSFYIQGLDDISDSGNMSVTADLYRKDAPKATEEEYRVFHGVKELPKPEAILLQPFDTVTIHGYYPTTPDINNEIGKEAAKKGAASFFIVRNISVNDGGNQEVTAYIYKKDAPKRAIQSSEAVVPYDSDAGRALIAEGGSAANKVEKPGLASNSDFDRNVGVFAETQSSGKSGHYTVTLPDGTEIQEVNKAAAALMEPFDTITFSGYFVNSPEVSYQVAKRAAEKGAKYYHITREWQSNGGTVTITADLFK